MVAISRTGSGRAADTAWQHSTSRLEMWRWCVVLAGALLVGAAPTPPLPHIVFVLGDDIGWNNVGWHSPIPQTPNLDRLRSGGVSLEHHYAQRCYPHNVGMPMYGKGSGNEEERSAVPFSFKFMPAVLKEAGYSTHQLGKWHIGFFSQKYVPVSHTCGEPCKDLLNTTVPANESAFAFNDVYSTEMYSAVAKDLIMDHDPTVPFFLYMAFLNCHGPYQCPDSYQDLYPELPEGMSQRCVNGMMTALDDAVGNITAALEAKGMMNNTVLVFSSDNGGPARMANNMPLRGAKFGVFEGGMRVPAFVHSSLLPSDTVGRSLTGVVHMTDWYKTFARLAGVSVSDTGPVPPDGFDQWDALMMAGQPGQPVPRKELVHNYDTNQDIYAFRSGDWKVLYGNVGEDDWIPDISYKSGCVPLLPPHLNASGEDVGEEWVWPVEDVSQYRDSNPCPMGKPCLFNVMEDPTEHHNLADSRPDMLELLLKQLNASVAHRYTGGLDHSTVAEDTYCAWIKKEKWVHPYEEILAP